MKLQPASRNEIIRISKGVLICDLLLVAVLFLLSLVGVGSFSLFPILLGVVLGSLVAIANFALLCLTVQFAADSEDKSVMKKKFQFSYNLRLLVQAGWVVLCFAIPQIHFFAGALPVLFPNVVIYYLQMRNKLVPQTPRSPNPTPSEDEPEDRLESFEI